MRKKPRQGRSRSMVDSLVEATAICIAEDGLPAATAARIAERAGVSVGSLYQYFARKEDLYAAVLERITVGLKALVAAEIERLPNKSIEDFVRDLLHAVWSYLETDRQRYLRVTRYWAQLEFVAVMNDLERQMTTALGVYLMHHPARRPVQDLPTKVYVLVNSVLFTIVRYISEPSPQARREQIIECFAEMAAALLPAPTKRAGAGAPLKRLPRSPAGRSGTSAPPAARSVSR
ncbi:TetR/AcrR family transcriptional regulator [Stagnimonas aquatica]|nr:TetR/AcrR family transcriptional regulator [Stagnimonas aquatica]